MTMRGPASTLSACAHVHTHYKKAQWCMFGGSTPHEEEAEGGMFSPAVLKEWDIMVRPTAAQQPNSSDVVNLQEATALGHMQGC